MKKARILRYFLLMLMIFFIILFINFIIRAAISIKNDNGHLRYNMRNVVESISISDDGEVSIDEDTRSKLISDGKFLMLISDDGDVVWCINKPDEIPMHYTLSDIAAFSRWYLKDHPVYTEITDNGLLVLGEPKNSIWRYNLTVEISEIESLIHIFPFVLVIDFLLAIIIPFFILRKQEKAADMERVQWISGVSHDIRTPLSIILGNAEKLMQDKLTEIPAENVIYSKKLMQGKLTDASTENVIYTDKSDDTFADKDFTCAKSIKTQALRIRELVKDLNIENMLDYGIKKTNEKILLPKLIRDVICEVMEQDEDGIYETEFEVDPSLCNIMIKADEGLIRRMLENLILNSMTHNPNGCKIKVSLSPAASSKWFGFQSYSCVLAVSDNGVGTSSDTLLKLNSKTDDINFSEHGLGLSVVKKIAMLYHYKISFSSQNGFVCNIEIA